MELLKSLIEKLILKLLIQSFLIIILKINTQGIVIHAQKIKLRKL